MSRFINFVLLTILIFYISFPVFAQQNEPGAVEASPDASQNMVADNVAPMTDIHDIKPAQPLGINPAVFYYVLFALFVMVLLGVAWFYWKKSRDDSTAEIALLSPEEQANRLLDELGASENIDGKEFYFRLSAILRGYIHGRFGVDALEMTTEELLPKVETLALEREDKIGVKGFIQDSDPVKFAGVPAVQAKMQHHLTFVRGFVEKTTPVDIEDNSESDRD